MGIDRRDAPAGIPAEALRACGLLRDALGDAVRAVYLFGSTVAGGLRPDSDVDVLAVVDRPLERDAGRALVAGPDSGGLSRPAGRYPPFECVP